MSQQAQLYQLILKSSPQVDSLRERAINGNKHALQTFNKTLLSLLKQPNHHPLAYKQINQILISAQPDAIASINIQVLPAVAESHCREDLDQYIICWKRMMPGTELRLAYPNLYQRFNKLNIMHPNRQLSAESAKSFRIFQKNFDTINGQRVQFFSDADGDSFLTDSIDQASSEIIEFNMQEIQEIRRHVQKGPIDQLRAEQYLKKIKNFLSMRPKSLKKQLSLSFNNDQIWAKQFMQNYNGYLSGGSLNLHKYFNKTNIQAPSKTRLENKSVAEINIHDDPEEVHYNQESFKKMNSKRYQLTSQMEQPTDGKKFISSLKPNIKMEQTKTNNRPSMIKPIQTNIPIINSDQVTYSKPKILDDNYPLANSNYHDTLTVNKRNTVPTIPHFILSTQQMKQISPQIQKSRMSNNSRMRPKIFGNGSWKSKDQEPKQEELVITKYGKDGQTKFNSNINIKAQNKNQNQQNQMYDNSPGKQSYGINSPSNKWTILSEQDNRNPFNISNSKQNQNYFKTANNNITPIHHKKFGEEMISPNTAFQNKTAYAGTGTTNKKLSQFNQQKKQRKMGLINEELVPIQNYLIQPYSQNFYEPDQFSRFRRNCLQDNFTLYASPLLLISCIVRRMADSKVKIQMLYHNQSHANLAMETLYRVPKCLKVQKYSQISKRWILIEQSQHSFSLQLLSFPLEPCLLNIKYSIETNNDDFKLMHPTVISIPVTLRNFLQYLVLNEDEWIGKWTKWCENGNFRINKHVILDKQVVHEDELSSALKDFTILNPVQGYSIKQFGGYCWQPKFNNLNFLLRISQRVQNIMTLEILSDRRIRDQDEIDYLEYCLNMWSMLIAKIDINAIY